MFRAVSTVACACLFAAGPTIVEAQTVLTLESTIARARDQAGPVAVARARIGEAEADLVDASARFRDNPVLEGGAGPRMGTGLRSTDIEVSASQQFETGGQRQARIATAQASIDRSRAEVQQVARTAVFGAAVVFLDGVAATERLQIAEDADRVARDLLNATERRFALGDIAAIDLNLARVNAAKAAATLVSARADLTNAVGELRRLLRIPMSEPLELRGSLDLGSPPSAEGLATSVELRPEFAVLQAEERLGQAKAQLGRSLGRPDLGFRVGYWREQSDTILLGGLTVTLPAFQKGQGTLASGLAQQKRARIEADIARESALAELRTAIAVYEQRSGLSTTLQSATAATLLDNETLARRSYEAGEMSLMDLLLVRRDVLDTRLAVIERRLETAISRVRIDHAAGVLR
jgi:cobalt-zinc-cadmium efflux system outer membrane protein